MSRWLVIWYDGNRQRAALVDDRMLALPYRAEGSAALRRALVAGEEDLDFQVNAVIEMDGELGVVVLDDAEQVNIPHVLLGA